MIWGGILGVVVIVGIGIAIGNSGGEPPPPPPPIVRKPDLGMGNERVQSVVKWANAVKQKDRFVAEPLTDFASLQRQLGVESATPFAAAPSDVQDKIKDAVFEKLYTAEETVALRDFTVDDGRLPEEGMATASSGRVVLGGAADDREKYKHYDPRMQLGVDFVWQSPHARVTGFEVLKIPKLPPPRETLTPLKEIPKAKEVERVIHGQKVKVMESEIVPLGHLEDTPEPLRNEIDDQIAKLVAMDAPGGQAMRSRLRLKEIGRPAIPRLLNKFYEIKGDNKDEIEALGRLDRLLRDMTGVAFNYTTVTQVGQTAEFGKEERESALRQWYAWWREWHNRDYTYNIQKEDDETIFLTDEQRKAREAASSGKTPDKK